MHELARSINRVYGYVGEREAHLANLKRKAVGVFWFLPKIANRFDVDLEAEAQAFVRRAGEWPAERVEQHRSQLVAGLCTLDRELAAAKRNLDLS